MPFNQEIRDLVAKMKLIPNRSLVNGKTGIFCDDSIVRGTQLVGNTRDLYEAGIREIHMRIASPPYISPCYYGVDTPDTDKLIAANMSVEEIKDYIEVDSLGYISIEGMLKVMGDHGKEFCVSCFDGKYPESIEPPPHYLKPTQ